MLGTIVSSLCIHINIVLSIYYVYNLHSPSFVTSSEIFNSVYIIKKLPRMFIRAQVELGFYCSFPPAWYKFNSFPHCLLNPLGC